MHRVDAIDRKILDDCRNGPRWARRFQHVKPCVQGLVEAGLLVRVKPKGGRGANMVALTAAGLAAIEKAA